MGPCHDDEDQDARLAAYLAGSAPFRMGLQLHFAAECTHALLNPSRPCEPVFFMDGKYEDADRHFLLVQVVHTLDLRRGALRHRERLRLAHDHLAGITDVPIRRALACNRTSDGRLPFPVSRIGPSGRGEVHVISVDEFCEDGTRFDAMLAPIPRGH